MTEQTIPNLVVNKVESQDVYTSMQNNGQINDNELYLVEGPSFLKDIMGVSNTISTSGSDCVFRIMTYTVSSVSISSGNYLASTSASGSLSGFYPVGIISYGFDSGGTGTSYGMFYRCFLNRTGSASAGYSATIDYGVRNVGSSAISGTLRFEVLWVKYK